MFWDHGTWYRKETIRMDDVETFNALILSTREADEANRIAYRPPDRQLTPSDITRAMQIGVMVCKEAEK